MSECCSVDLSVNENRSIDLDVLGDSYIGEIPTMSTVQKGCAKVGAGLEVNSDEFLNIAPSGVVSSMIDDGAVTSAKIADGAVTTGKIADGAVTPNKIPDGSVSLAKLSNDVTDILDGTVRAFDTVADMQSATDLEAGMVAHTNGFHAAGDGGAAFYTVGTAGTANGMDILALQNSLIATLVITESYVTPEMFGAYGDGIHDDTSAFIAALSYKNSQMHCIPLKCIGIKTYKFDSEVSIPTVCDINLDGCGASFYDLSIRFNMSGYSSYEKYVYCGRAQFANMNVRSNDVFSDEFFIKTGSPFIAKNIITRNVPYFAVFSTDAFLDNLTISHCGSVIANSVKTFAHDAFCTYDSNGNIVSNSNAGDSILFESCSFGGFDSDLNVQTVFSTEQNSSFAYRGCVNGFIDVGSHSTVLIDSCQFEGYWNADQQQGYGFKVSGEYSVNVECCNCRFDFNSRPDSKFTIFNNCTFEAFRHSKKSFVSYGFDFNNIKGDNNYIGFDNSDVYNANIKIPNNKTQSQIHDTVSRIINFGTYAYGYVSDYGYDVGVTYTLTVYPSLFADIIAGCNHNADTVQFTPIQKADYSLLIYNQDYADGIYLHAYLTNSADDTVKKAILLVPNHNDVEFIGSQNKIQFWHNLAQFGFNAWEDVSALPSSGDISKYAGYRYDNMIMSTAQQSVPNGFINIITT